MPARIQRRQIKRLQTADWPVKDTKHRARLSCNNKKQENYRKMEKT